MMARRIDLPSLRAAAWTVRALTSARRQLRRRDIRDLRVPPPPPVGPAAARGVGAILRRNPGTCLTRASVRQAWHAAQGHPRDIVIGVKREDGDFRAHAWLDGDPEDTSDEFQELTRQAAPPSR